MPRIPICSHCGQRHVTRTDKLACAGHVTRERADDHGYRAPLNEPRPCENAPMNGQRVCGSHGGRSARAKNAAANRRAAEAIEADARRLLAYSTDTLIDDPLAVIHEMTQMAYALTHAAAARVNALDDIRYTGGLERDERGELRGTGTEQLRAEVALLERSIDRTARLGEVLVKHTRTEGSAQTRDLLTQLGQHLGVIPTDD